MPKVVGEMVIRERVVEETERVGQTGNLTSSNLPPPQPGEEVTDIESLIVPDLRDIRQAELSQISPDNSAIRRSKTFSSSPDGENHTQHGVGVTSLLHAQVGPLEETGHQSSQHQMSDLLTG